MEKRLVIDACSLFTQALQKRKDERIYDTMESFFKKLADSKTFSSCPTEFIFTSFDSRKAGTHDASEGHRMCHENALNAWGIMKNLAIEYRKSSDCVYVCNDAFTGVMHHAMREPESCIICTNDARFVFAANECWVLMDFFDAVNEVDQKEFRILKNEGAKLPPLWVWSELAAIERCCASNGTPNAGLVDHLKCELAKGEGVSNEWLQNCTNLIDDAKKKMTDELAFSVCVMAEESRIKGKMGLATAKISKRRLIYERPNPCCYISALAECNSLPDSYSVVSNLIHDGSKLCSAKCFPALQPIRDAFGVYVDSPSKERRGILDVLAVETDDGNSLSALTQTEWDSLLQEKTLPQRAAAVALALLGKAGIDSDTIEQAHHIIFIYDTERPDGERKHSPAWIEFQCALMHTYLAAEVANSTELCEFPFLADYC